MDVASGKKNGDGQKDTQSSPSFVGGVKLNPGYNNEVIYVWPKRLTNSKSANAWMH